MVQFDEWLSKEMKDPEFKEEYEKLGPEFQLVDSLLASRRELGLTQKELAERSGVHQVNISRIESGTGNPSVATLKKLAHGMGKQLVILFV